MSNEITEWEVQQYADNVQLLLQQMGSKFARAVMEDTHIGKAARPVEQIGAVTAQKKTTRHADTPLIETPHDARWVYPVDYEWADLIDDQDRLRLISDPTSPYAMNGAMSLGRAKDDEIIAAFFGTAQTGETGGTATTFPAGQQVANTVGAGAATGMNVAKLRNAMQLLLAAEVDTESESLWCAMSAAQHDDLLSETQAVSLDFNTRPVLVDGRISS
ncbi:MAG: phage capsid protein, partial [Geminicoccaceae bacterium]